MKLLVGIPRHKVGRQARGRRLGGRRGLGYEQIDEQGEDDVRRGIEQKRQPADLHGRPSTTTVTAIIEDGMQVARCAMAVRPPPQRCACGGGHGRRPSRRNASRGLPGRSLCIASSPCSQPARRWACSRSTSGSTWASAGAGASAGQAQGRHRAQGWYRSDCARRELLRRERRKGRRRTLRVVV